MRIARATRNGNQRKIPKERFDFKADGEAVRGSSGRATMIDYPLNVIGGGLPNTLASRSLCLCSSGVNSS